LRGDLEPMAAKVVRASFEQGELHRHPERLREQRHVATKQLVLQRAGAGRDDHAAPGQQRGDEIGEGLPGTRPRLHDQGLEARECRADRTCHAGLFTAMGKTGQRACERPIRAEQVVDGGGHGVG